jgi:hypothetical protein
MTRGTPRLSLTGSPLIRLLARLAEVDAPDSKQAFAERLSHWLGWTDAISLSAALKGSASGALSAPRTGGATADGERASVGESPQARECHRVRTSLEKALADEHAPEAARPRSHRGAIRPEPVVMDVPTDFASYRRRYFTRQQAMDAAIGPLRTQLRTALTQRSPELARLAAVDAVMEQALAERERTLLSMVPVLLEKRFERLRLTAPADTVDASTDSDSSAQPSAAPSAGVWLETFRQDMHSVLLAELDLRWQPIDGLLEALRT